MLVAPPANSDTAPDAVWVQYDGAEESSSLDPQRFAATHSWEGWEPSILPDCLTCKGAGETYRVGYDGLLRAVLCSCHSGKMLWGYTVHPWKGVLL